MRLSIILFLFLLLGQSAICQIFVDTAHFNVSQENSKSCIISRYVAKIPVIKYDLETIKSLNDTIYSIYKEVYNQFYTEIKFPSFEDAFNISSCVDENGLSQQLDELTEVSFNIYFLSDSLISLYILETQQNDGNQVASSNETLYSLNYNLKNGEFINWKKQVPVNLLEKARLLLAKTMNEQFNPGRDSIPAGIPKIEDIEHVCLSNDKIRVFGYMSLSRHGWFEFADVPIEKKKFSKHK